MTTLTVDVNVDLDDFDTDDLIEELESRGYVVSKSAGVDTLGDLDHVEHLVICGQASAARSEALELVGKAIGRAL